TIRWHVGGISMGTRDQGGVTRGGRRSATSACGPMTTAPTARRVVAWQAWVILLGAIWGCTFWWIKLGLRAMSPVDVAFARLAAGAATLLVIAGITRTPLPQKWKTWRHLFILSALLNSAPFTLFSYGETRISAVLAGVLQHGAQPAALIGPRFFP